MQQIFDYISIEKEAPLNAVNMTSKLFESMSSLSVFPQRCKRIEVDYQMADYRKMLVDSFTILYIIEDSAVYIENIYHNKSDIEKRVQQMFRRVL